MCLLHTYGLFYGLRLPPGGGIVVLLLVLVVGALSGGDAGVWDLGRMLAWQAWCEPYEKYCGDKECKVKRVEFVM